MLGRFAFDVRGLVGEVPAGGMNALAAGVENRGDRMLGEPVDLEIGVQLAKLVGDGPVALGVTETDGR